MRWPTMLLYSSVGLLLLLGGLLWGAVRLHLLLLGARTTGTVVEIASDQDWTLYPTVEFRSLDGRLWRFSGSSVNHPDVPEVGSPVPVLYRKDRPGTAIIFSFGQFWAGPALVLLAGALFTLGGAGSYWLSHRMDRAF